MKHGGRGLRHGGYVRGRGDARIRGGISSDQDSEGDPRGPQAPARDRTIKRVSSLGRRAWKKTSGYHQQARVENAFFRYKSIPGDGLRARSLAGQTTETVRACNILNRMTGFGRAASYSIGR